MEQFDPSKHGLYRRFLKDDGSLNTPSWNRAADGGEHVGTCRECGFYLLGSPTQQDGRITWYSAYCTNPACGKETAAPNAEYLRRTSRHSHMPEGYWAQRISGKEAA